MQKALEWIPSTEKGRGVGWGMGETSLELSVVAHPRNPNTQETKAEGSQ